MENLRIVDFIKSSFFICLNAYNTNIGKLRSRSYKYYFFLHFEWLVLAAALILMAAIDPTAERASFCIIDRFGFTFCPGCGLGRSVAYLFRGDLMASLTMHPAGILAVLILLGRIGSILKRNKNVNKEMNHEKNI
ncbi:MAG: DUF2752 domain-containing protein [Balneolaceae bacterium]|nr:DUF2752 domain-containing protein [Balneolaceae bacterium]